MSADLVEVVLSDQLKINNIFFQLILEKQKFILRAHTYQARSLIGSDASGLSGEKKFDIKYFG